MEAVLLFYITAIRTQNFNNNIEQFLRKAYSHINIISLDSLQTELAFRANTSNKAINSNCNQSARKVINHR